MVFQERRENLFRTKCRVKDKTCNMIIDIYSYATIALSDMVGKLQLPTGEYACPYRIKWLSDATVIK